MNSGSGELTDSRLVDHHVHGVVATPLERPGFELLMNEGGAPAPRGTSHFDSPVGLAVLMHCAPVLGVDPGSSAARYLQTRADLGAEQVNHRLLGAAGLAALLVDTGHRPADVAGPARMGQWAGARAYQVTRIEAVAEQLASTADGPAAVGDRLGEALDAAAADSVGFKSVVAYRYGFDLDPAVPSGREVRRAADEWFTDAERHQHWRLTSPVLLRHLLHTAAEVAAPRRLPLQLHAGFGDTDLTLHRSDPSLFTPWIRELGRRGVAIVFLHCYPYHRQAGYLAAVYPHVSFDVGCMPHYTGASAVTVVAEALELAPFTKLLYSSDGFGLAEFVYLGSLLFRRALDQVLHGWTARGDCTAAAAGRIRTLVGSQNSRRLYSLPDDIASEA